MVWLVINVKLYCLLGLMINDLIVIGCIGNLFDFIIVIIWLFMEILNG